eukprot:2701453-Prymnesium_polylepis.3
MCAALRERARPGTWLHPNSGAFVGTLRGARRLLQRLHGLVGEGHFEDQGMVGLAMLQASASTRGRALPESLGRTRRCRAPRAEKERRPVEWSAHGRDRV